MTLALLAAIVATVCIVALVGRPIPLRRSWAAVGGLCALIVCVSSALSESSDRRWERGKAVCSSRGGWTMMVSAQGKRDRVFCADNPRRSYPF